MAPARAALTALSQRLFPAPSVFRSKLSPSLWAGVTSDSTKTLQRVLQDNHNKWHVYFNEEGFHNHASHHVLATWALGANAQLIQAAYKSNEQREAFKSPEPITKDNFYAHLGDDKYYNSYMEFFRRALEQQGISSVLEEYFFAQEANFPNDGHDSRLMLNRLMDSLYHPMIHIGYGLEFGLPGMLVEGLAQAAIHQALWPAMTPPSLWAEGSPVKSSEYSSGQHIFDILADMAIDSNFARIVNPDPESMAILYHTYFDHQVAVLAYAKRWVVDTASTADVQKKLEELVWLVTLIYGVGGWKRDAGFEADFFYMHLVTSSLFLSSYVNHLSTASLKKLLESYCTFALMWWVARGRPPLDIAGFFATDIPTSSQMSAVSSDALTFDATTSTAAPPNPWLPIINSTLIHPDNHIAKLQRALAHYSTLYGGRAAGQEDFARTKLAGAEKLDGSLFIRVAALSAEKLGRVAEGEKASDWYRDGFYHTA
ncbi:hypothetical protein PC9H_002541 [Pleurotus ostreatus]|uniref:Oxidoreductase AflY n=1 Tax=Pleurotus ostreatus TaxID=5322 RepID=A0A8H7DKJ8_PLEOS|nr:uncharacterized protein PC9H_002541 [Pleurotus ostreatus]KAF7416276.1 hypothetical protein PC9H_002541 [Pleurotus ostreatus]KAJ8689147.1 hypothetical protein PTI98_013201 [Pleurotus ostreatus]